MITTEQYSLSYEYEINGNMLILMEYDSDTGNGDVGMYLNFDKATEEEKEMYYYALDIYNDLSLNDYLMEGSWYENEYSNLEELNDFSLSMLSKFYLYEDEDGNEHMSSRLSYPETDEDTGDDINGSLITIGGLNAFRIIPIDDDRAYFYCYADGKLTELQRIVK